MYAFYIDLLGYVAAFFTTISLLPEIYRTVKIKEARDLSFYWIGALAMGQIFWLAYAAIIDALPLLVAAVVTLALCIIQLLLAVKYDRIRIIHR